MFPQFIHEMFLYNSDNFSLFYVFSLSVSFILVFTTVLFAYFKKKHKGTTEKPHDDDCDDSDDSLISQEYGLQAKYKLAKQRLLKKQLALDHNKEEEKRIEAQTLETVRKLLQEQHGSSTPTIDELREQMNLYRRK